MNVRISKIEDRIDKIEKIQIELYKSIGNLAESIKNNNESLQLLITVCQTLMETNGKKEN